MSCDAPVAMSFLFLSAFSPQKQAPAHLTYVAAPAAASAAAPAPKSVAGEPLYADIIKRAGQLRSQTDQWEKQISASGAAKTAPAKPIGGFSAYVGQIKQLADLDEKGHVDLLNRNLDGDLKCILHGISQDMPKKLADIQSAKTMGAQTLALREMFALLRDNVEVLTAPPMPEV